MEINTKLQEHMNELFAAAPPSRAVLELKEELIANTYERYTDLVAGGMEEQAAYQSAVGSIGNVDELISALPPDATAAELMALQGQYRQKRAVITAAAVGLYILAGIVLIVGQLIFWSNIALAVALGICIIPTCMLVYSGIAFPQYKKSDDTVVEEFKQYSSDQKRAKAIKGAVSTIIWLLTLCIYFVVSFTTGAWYITWVLFLAAACVEAAVILVFNLKGM